jgi:hypothetical protein
MDRNKPLRSQHARNPRTITVQTGSRSTQTTLTRRKGRLHTKTSNHRVIGPANSIATAPAVDQPPRQSTLLPPFRSSSPSPAVPTSFSDDFPSDIWSHLEIPSDPGGDIPGVKNLVPNSNISTAVTNKKPRVCRTFSFFHVTLNVV